MHRSVSTLRAIRGWNFGFVFTKLAARRASSPYMTAATSRSASPGSIVNNNNQQGGCSGIIPPVVVRLSRKNPARWPGEDTLSDNTGFVAYDCTLMQQKSH